jgi:uncharacterized membrane protein HdeD (DUF308 family)
MKRKQIVDLIIAIFLIVAGSVVIVLPVLNVASVKWIFGTVLALYGLLNLIKFLLTFESKDVEGLLTSIASIATLIIALKINVESKPWNLALTLFIWVIMMSLIKLKKSDYYNDRHNKMWILRIITLMLFILSGLLCTINLYYTPNVQVLVLGFFFFINGILELIDPITIYLRK